MAIATLLAFILCIGAKMYLYYRTPISDYSENELARLLDCQMDRLVLSSKIQVSRCLHARSIGDADDHSL